MMNQLFIDLSGGTATQAENAEAKRLKAVIGSERYDELRDRIFLGALKSLERPDWPATWQEFLTALREEVRH